MIEQDRAPFFALLGDVYVLHGKALSESTGNAWWSVMKIFDWEDVHVVLARHPIASTDNLQSAGEQHA